MTKIFIKEIFGMAIFIEAKACYQFAAGGCAKKFCRKIFLINQSSSLSPFVMQHGTSGDLTKLQHSGPGRLKDVGGK
jgi:hypothetical protein